MSVIASHRQLDCMLKSLLKLTQTETWKLRITSLLWGKSTGVTGITMRKITVAACSYGQQTTRGHRSVAAFHSTAWVCTMTTDNELMGSGSWFNIKMSSYQYRKSHCGDKTVVRSSYLHNGISYTGKMASLYWISPLKCFIKFSTKGSSNFIKWFLRK